LDNDEYDDDDHHYDDDHYDDYDDDYDDDDDDDDDKPLNIKWPCNLLFTHENHREYLKNNWGRKAEIYLVEKLISRMCVVIDIPDVCRE
jgi:hypothetical protein